MRREKVATAVASFPTTTNALAFKQVAEREGLLGHLAPIPRQLSAGCGMAWLEPGVAPARLSALARCHKIETEQVTELEL